MEINVVWDTPNIYCYGIHSTTGNNCGSYRVSLILVILQNITDLSHMHMHTHTYIHIKEPLSEK
jgi:hypothetical protein